MDKKFNFKVNEKIAEVLNCFVMEVNDEKNKQKIAYEIKCFLESEGIDYETVNLHTSQERIEQGHVDIRIDDELYPFEEIFDISEDNWIEYCFRWENGKLNCEEEIKLFQYLINEGIVWNSKRQLYARAAEDMVVAGLCTLSYKDTKGSYIWGNPTIPSKFDLKPNAPGTDAYVQKRKELSDDEFFEWVNLQIDNKTSHGINKVKSESIDDLKAFINNEFTKSGKNRLF